MAKALIWTTQSLQEKVFLFDDISHSLRFTFKVNQVSLPLIGVDHELVEVGVVLDDALRNHLDDVLVAVLQLVQLQIDSEHIFPDGVGTGFESATHHVPAEEVGSREEGQLSLFSAISANLNYSGGLSSCSEVLRLTSRSWQACWSQA